MGIIVNTVKDVPLLGNNIEKLSKSKIGINHQSFKVQELVPSIDNIIA